MYVYDPSGSRSLGSDPGIRFRDPLLSNFSTVHLLSNFTMGSDWIMDPILHLVERSSRIIDAPFGSMDMSAANIDSTC